MRLPRPIFQALAMATLALALGLAAQSVMEEWAPYTTIASTVGNRGLAALLTVLGALVAAAVAVLPMRALSEMPSLRGEVARARDAARDLDLHVPPDARRRHLQLALGGAVVGTLSGTVTVAQLVAFPERIAVAFPAVALVAAAAVPWHLWKAWTTRR